jgi:hypothetical protein
MQQKDAVCKVIHLRPLRNPRALCDTPSLNQSI